MSQTEKRNLTDLQVSIIEAVERENPWSDRAITTKINATGRMLEAATILQEKYGRLTEIERFKPKHFEAIADGLKSKGLADSSIKNTLGNFRVLMRSMGKHDVVKAKNIEFGVRRFAATDHKAWSVKDQPEKFAQLSPRGQAIAMVAEAFGLRPAEAVQTQIVKIADRGDKVAVSGQKGTRPRSVVVRTEQQQKAAAFARSFLRGTSYKNLAMHQKIHGKNAVESATRAFSNEIKAAYGKGFSPNGLRHQYVQARVSELQKDGFTKQQAADIAHGEIGHGDGRTIAVYMR